MPIEFIHSDTGSIRCPLHNQRESFTAGHIIQPMDSRQVRYPCGYVDGLASASPSIEPALPVLRRDELLAELVNRLKRLEERPYTRPRPMPTTPRGTAPAGRIR